MRPADVEYTVVLLTPTFGDERENAQETVEEALEYLNTHREQPGFRFAPYVSAQLQVVSDLEEAQTALSTDDSVAMMILHGLDDGERLAFMRECRQQDVAVCYTVPAPDDPDAPPAPRLSETGWQIRFRKRSEEDGPPAHRIRETVLTAPLDGDPDEMSDRIWQLIAVMALGVMEHHWLKNPR